MKTEAEVPSDDGRKMLIKVPLEVPIMRGETRLDSITMRRPDSGALRGLSLVQLGQMNVDEIRKLLPRITLEGLIVEEVDRIDPADMMEIAGELGDFLLPKRHRAA